MQLPECRAEHKWLLQLVGDWTYEHECEGPPGEPKMTHTGTQQTRAVGELWTIGEGKVSGPEGCASTMIFTLGYDHAKQKFVGTFIGSMMDNMWLYEGTLDASGKVLTLDTEGPSFADPTKIAKYQDIVEVISPDHYTLKSRYQMDDGSWNLFMDAHYRRAK